MPTLTIDGTDLYYETHGEGPFLVFAHGAGGNHLSWWQQVPAFRDRYTCVTFDHRGFGRSDDPRPADQWPGFAADLEALLDHLEAPDVRLVAQSMGGWTCLAYAAAHPERVRALVMGDTVGGLELPPPPPAPQSSAPLVNRALAEGYQEANPAMTFLYQQIEGLNPRWDRAQLRPMLQRQPVTVEATLGITCPFLFIHGDEDTVIPLERAQSAVGVLSNARLAIVPGAGHSVYFEQPEAFNMLVADLLSEADAPSAPSVPVL